MSMVVIRADANSTIGMGHIMRCSAVATAIKDSGSDVCFLISPDSSVDMVQGLGFRTYQLKEGGELGWNPLEAARWLKYNKADAVLVDSYRVNETALKELSSIANLFYLDDVYAFDYPIKNIINYNLEATNERYTPTVYAERNLYLGAKYFPVRKQIVDARIKKQNEKVKRVLVSTGSTDPCRMSLGILQRLLENKSFYGIQFVALLGRYYDEGYKAEIEQYAKDKTNIELLSWTDDIGKLYASCDLVIAPGSTTIFEAFTVGVPCISFCFVDNQIFQCETMAKMKMSPYAGDFRYDYNGTIDCIEKELENALDIKVRKALSKEFSDVFDGYGAQRIASLLLGKVLYKIRGGG